MANMVSGVFCLFVFSFSPGKPPFAQWGLLSSSSVPSQRQLRKKYLTNLRLKAVSEITSKVAKLGEISCVKNLLALFIHHGLGQGS